MVKMKTITGATGALLAGSVAAHAGGIERQAFNPGFLFESGNYFEMTFGAVSPSVSGVFTGAPLQSGDMAETYTTISGALKYQINEDLAIGIVIDQPVGVDVAYPAGTFYPFASSTATVDAVQLSVLGHYRFSPNFSVYGGLRAQRAEGRASVTPLPPNPYVMSTATDTAYGYVVGVAYERPEIALRVALSYVSEMTHDFSATDNLLLPGPADFSTTIPQGVNLDFQTGIAADTLLFGSIRWRDWSEFTIMPRGIVPLSTDNKDTITYSLGVGRKFSDTFSGSVSLGHEPAVGGIAGNLGPTDGYTSVTLAGVYTDPSGFKVTVGASYGWVGDATTAIGGAQGRFSDNNYVAVGMKVGWKF